jgi:hypothetical protein
VFVQRLDERALRVIVGQPQGGTRLFGVLIGVVVEAEQQVLVPM